MRPRISIRGSVRSTVGIKIGRSRRGTHLTAVCPALFKQLYDWHFQTGDPSCSISADENVFQKRFIIELIPDYTLFFVDEEQ